MKKLDHELQKFKLELEADHAGITSKLEQVISSKDTSSNYTNNASSLSLVNSLTGNVNGKGEESDFTLSSSANLMMMLTNCQNSTNHTNANNTNTSNSIIADQLGSNLHKRKHSNLSEKNSSNVYR